MGTPEGLSASEVAALRSQIANAFGLGSDDFDITHPPDEGYNCIAWAAGDVARFWWPTGSTDNRKPYWPYNHKPPATPDSFEKAFATLGYKRSSKRNPKPRKGVEYIALYCVNGAVKHASKLLSDGTWSSKLGEGPVITHTLHALKAGYGEVCRILERPTKG